MSVLAPQNMELTDGSRIGVVGGGPAGSFFSYYTLEYARRFGLEVELDIFEAKDFTKIGASGCNHCGGIISESLVQDLATDGLIIPSDIIQRTISTYTLHTEQGSRVIRTPSDEHRIASVFRGSGPRGCLDTSLNGFDNYMLELCEKNGARVIREKVTALERSEDGITVGYAKSAARKYDLVVGAVGLSNKTLDLFKTICPAYSLPEKTRAYISEFMMKPANIEKSLGSSMHVFLLDLPQITFGALIPKYNYVTLVLLGRDIDKDVVQNFVQSAQVRSCFPADYPIDRIAPCQCYPYINIKQGKHAYANRVVLVGDSGSSKLYKNGIGAALITAKAAASTAIFEGISEKHFEKYYAPVCRDLDRDNGVGKLIFRITRIIQKSSIIKKGLLHQVGKEQSVSGSALRLSAALWDTFTGSSGYRNILKRFLHPGLLLGLIGSTTRSNVPPFNRNSYEKQKARQAL